MTLTHQSGSFIQTSTDTSVINLGLGQPSPSLLPLSLIHDAASTALGPGADRLLLQYGSIRGPRDFLRLLASFLEQPASPQVDESQLLVTGGTSIALDMVSQVLAKPGDTVVCGDPTYFLAKGIFRDRGLQIRGIPVDHDGLQIDHLESALEDGIRPAIVYCIPSFQNPRGVELCPKRAERLVDLAQYFGFIVIADDPYTHLAFDGRVRSSMMDHDRGRGRVVSLGTFSKILGPGLRLGWAHAAPSLIERFSQYGPLRSGGGQNPVIATLVGATLENGSLQTHISRLRSTLKRRCDALAQSLRDELPHCRFLRPNGGYFLWLDLGQGVHAHRLSESARACGVTFTPGIRCGMDYPSPAHRHHARLSFAFYEVDELRDAVGRLARAIGEAHHGA